MKIKYALSAIFFSLLTINSYAQTSISVSPPPLEVPPLVSDSDTSDTLVLQKQSCSAATKAWKKLSQLSEHYDDYASNASGDKQDAWCEKYDAVKSALSGIETYHGAICSGNLDSSDSSGGAKLAGPSVCELNDLTVETTD